MIKKIILLSFVFTFLFFSEGWSRSTVDSVKVEPFGKVFTYRLTDKPKNVAILISGDEGWKSGVADFAGAFSEMNTLVIGVDILRYFKNLRARTDECYNLAIDFVKLATEIEKIYNLPNYVPPIIMGYSSGATLVYGILAQARAGTFAGGISIGFCPDLELPRRLCQINGLSQKALKEGKTYLLEPDARLGNQWIVLHGKLDKVCNYSVVEDFVKHTTDAELVSLPNVGHGFSKWNDFMPQWKNAFTRIIENSDKADPSAVLKDDLKGIPIVTTTSKVQIKNAPIALLVSGDGGWYGFEQSIADRLALDGVPTVGLDSKKYFWSRRSPEETAEAVTKSLKYYSKEWGKDRFLIIGYSLGAEIVPFIMNRLPEQMRSESSVVLLSPAETTDFEIHISNMIGVGNRQNTYDVTSEIRKMLPVPTLIIFGEGEKPKLKILLKDTDVKISTIPGDHHYKFNLPLIVQTMKDNKMY